MISSSSMMNYFLSVYSNQLHHLAKPLSKIDLYNIHHVYFSVRSFFRLKEFYLIFFANRHINSVDRSVSHEPTVSPSTSPRSSSASISHYRIDYKSMPRKSESRGIWDGYNTRDEFLEMHFR